MSDVSFQGYATSLVPDAPGYNKNNSYAMAIASSLAYATMDVILDTVAQQWKAIPHYIGRGETQLFCAEFPELVVVAFRGTEP
ncbi:MAG: hypothetical protein HY303_14135, partial [Candidatus Wallbacteria bacterium]|nr:hypothetical protein [Candidatus Wallbacteria bacterium]